MNSAPATFPNTAQLVEIERAHIAVCMTRIYRLAGFGAVMRGSEGTLRALAEQVRDEGGELEGWCP
jgi:hypothetical protein